MILVTCNSMGLIVFLISMFISLKSRDSKEREGGKREVKEKGERDIERDVSSVSSLAE